MRGALPRVTPPAPGVGGFGPRPPELRDSPQRFAPGAENKSNRQYFTVSLNASGPTTHQPRSFYSSSKVFLCSGASSVGRRLSQEQFDGKEQEASKSRFVIGIHLWRVLLHLSGTVRLKVREARRQGQPLFSTDLKQGISNCQFGLTLCTFGCPDLCVKKSNPRLRLRFINLLLSVVYL